MSYISNIWQNIWPWSHTNISKRQEKACDRGNHSLIRRIIHTKCWAVDNIEYHCKYCSYKEDGGYKINYD